MYSQPALFHEVGSYYANGGLMVFPSEFEAKMKSLLGEEYEAYLACYEDPRYYGLRVNTQKISVEEFKKICPFEIKPIPWIDNGFYYDGTKVTPSKHPYYFAGLYYLQEPSAMTPANRLPIEEGDLVLDVCAAPGGKATELGAKLNRTGLLIANDLSNSRAKGLLKNIEVFGIGNVFVLSEDPGKFEDFFFETFDKILIDAPCSGEGMFRKDPKMVKAWQEHGPEFFANIQKGIVTKAARMLKPGGMLLYSTCTFDPSENEGTIEYLLSQYPQFEILDIAPYSGFACGIPSVTQSKSEDFKKTVRIFPHKMQGEGHFLALLRKTASIQEENTKKTAKVISCKKKDLPVELTEFLNHVNISFDTSRIELHAERVYYMPDPSLAFKGLRYLRTGLLLGEVKKNRFEPSQALAMYLRSEEYDQILNFSAEDDRVRRYLKGETIDVDDLVNPKEKGWYLVCVDTYPLGWGKLNNGTLKNKYLPGWRLA